MIDWLALGIYHLTCRANEGDHAAAAVLDELHRLWATDGALKDVAAWLDTDAVFVDVAQYVTPQHIVDFMQGTGALLPSAIDIVIENPPYTQTGRNEVLR